MKIKETKNYRCYTKLTPIINFDHIFGFEVKKTEVNSIWSQDGKSIVSKKFFVDEKVAKNYADSQRV
tara:strand:- start:252 stop:452 length:201 start_codon:yes stop_codon:yes gene_type:complete